MSYLEQKLMALRGNNVPTYIQSQQPQISRVRTQSPPHSGNYRPRSPPTKILAPAISALHYTTHLPKHVQASNSSKPSNLPAYSSYSQPPPVYAPRAFAPTPAYVLPQSPAPGPLAPLLSQADHNNLLASLSGGYAGGGTSSLSSPQESVSELASSIAALKSELGSQTSKTGHLQQDLGRRLAELKTRADTLAAKEREKGAEDERGRREEEAKEEERRRREKEADTVREENRKRREELVRLGEDINQKVAELDNKIGGVERLREHEQENSKFEIENIDSEFELVCAEMDKEYGERFKDIEVRIRAIDNDKERGGSQLIELSEKIKNLHRETERKAKTLIDEIKEAERRNLEEKKKEAEAKMRGIEEAIRNQKEKNEHIIRNMQEADKTSRINQNYSQTELNRIRMDLERSSRENNQLKGVAESFSKQLGQRESEKTRIETEIEVTMDHQFELDKMIENDQIELKEKIDNEKKGGESEIISLRERLRDLDDQISYKRSEYQKLRTEYEGLVQRLHQGLGNTISNEISGYRKRDY